MTGSCSAPADQSLAGITANDPADAVYLVPFNDAHGAKLSPGAATNCVAAQVTFTSGLGGEGARALGSAYPRGLLRCLRYQRTSVPDGKSSTQPTSS